MELVRFNRKLYKIEAIKRAIAAYKDLADFEIEEDGKCTKVFIKDIDKEVKNIIKDEFCNYVLYSMR